MMIEGALAPAAVRQVAVESAWSNLTSAGPTLTAAQRVSVIETARAGWAGEGRPGDDPMTEAAHWLAVDAGGITGELVDDVERRGLDRHRYLEVVGVVARLSNVDFYLRGLGAALPEPVPGDDRPPTGAVDSTTGITDGWVPATGPMFAPACLDALPPEGEALRAIHEPMYMPMNEMSDPAYEDGLARAQIEFIAARTSYLNECFY